MMRSKITFSICLICASLSLSACFDMDKYVNYDHVTIDPDENPEPGETPENPTEEIDPGEGGDIVRPGGSHGIEDGDEDIDTDPGGIGVVESFAATQVNPSRGRGTGGYAIQVRGTKFLRTDRVFIGAQESPQTVFVSDYVLRATVPAGHTGCVDVAVERGDGSERVTLEGAFCYTEDLDIASVEPNLAVSGEVTPVVIKGSGFEDEMSLYARSGDEIRPMIDVVRTGDVIEAVLPSLASGPIDIIVNTASDDETVEGAITLMPALGISSVTPSVIAANAPETVTVAGTGFGESVLSVRIGATSQTISSQSENELKVTVAPMASGCYDLVAYDALRQKRVEQALYVIEASDEVYLAGVVPARGPLEGNQVTVLGRMPETGDVTFGAQKAEVVSRDALSWTVTVPAVTAPQSVDVTIGELTLSGAYTYVSAPTADDIAPSHGTASTTVTLTGSGFDETLRVFADQFEGGDVVVLDEHTASFTMPSGSGNAKISLMQHGERYETGLVYRYEEETKIYEVSPNELSKIGGSTVTVYGKGFAASSSIKIDDEMMNHVEWIHPGKLQFTSQAHEAGPASLTLLDKDGQVQDTADVLFYEPAGISTHLSGGTLEGRMNVTVLTVSTNEIIPGATVYVGSNKDDFISGTTNAQGQVHFEDESLRGTQLVYACHTGYSCNTIQSFNARDVTIYLEKWEPATSSTIETPPPPPPDDGSSINPIDVTVTHLAKESYITGKVSGFDKIDLDTANDGNIVRAAYVIQSQLGPYTGSYNTDDVYLLFNENDTYKVRARKGNVAMGLVCGLYNTASGSFDPRYFGIRTGLYVTNDVTLTADLDCPLPLNQTQSIKMLNLPQGQTSTQLTSSAFINLGNHGYLGGFMKGTSYNDLVIITKVPPLRGPLEGTSLALQTQLYFDASYSGSFYSYNVEKTDTPVEVGPLVSLPKFDTLPEEFYYASAGNQTSLHNGKALMQRGSITWSVKNPEYVDFYELTIKGYFNAYGTMLFWQSYMPGNATSVEFPDREDYTVEGQEPTGILVTLTAYKSLRDGYDFNSFSTLDTKYSSVDSSAATSLYIPWNFVASTTTSQ